MPRLTDEQQNERRSQILQAAGRCFTRDGFHRTSMQRICKEAGMSPGALYLYFESKEALIAAMILAWLEPIGTPRVRPQVSAMASTDFGLPASMSIP